MRSSAIVWFLVHLLDSQLRFPHPSQADPSGLLAIGGDLSPRRVLLAYLNGIFPWPTHDMPLLWFSPDPRMVMEPGCERVSRSLAKRLRNGGFRVTADTAFREVIEACAQIPRDGQPGTWITEEMMETYEELHNAGIVHSVEVWLDDVLVGGLYGVSLGSIFCGESMFHTASDASKVAFVALSRQLRRWKFSLIDCQLHTPHLESLGAGTMSRETFMQRLSTALSNDGKQGRWQFDADLIG